MTCAIDGAQANRVATRIKEAPLSRGLLVACLLVCGGVFALLLVVLCGLCRAACTRREQALCQRNLTWVRRSNVPAGAPCGAKRDFGQYVTSDNRQVLSKSSTQGPGGCAT